MSSTKDRRKKTLGSFDVICRKMFVVDFSWRHSVKFSSDLCSIVRKVFFSRAVQMTTATTTTKKGFTLTKVLLPLLSGWFAHSNAWSVCKIGYYCRRCGIVVWLSFCSFDNGRERVKPENGKTYRFDWIFIVLNVMPSRWNCLIFNLI